VDHAGEGRIQSARYDTKSGKVDLTLDPASPTAPAARLLFETTTSTGRPYAIVPPPRP
jgi:hypothetical protein